MTRYRVYIVEDEALVAMELQERLEQLGYEVCGTAARGEDALDEIPRSAADLVIMDIRLAGELDGLETADRLRGKTDVPVVFLTAYSDDAIVDRARALGPYAYLLKPFDEHELRPVIEVALYKHAMDRRVLESEQRYELLLSAMPGAVFLFRIDPSGRRSMPFITDGILALTGFTPAEVAADLDELFDRIPMDALPDMERSIAESMESMGPWLLEFPFTKRDGSTTWIRGNSIPRREPDGGVIWNGVFVDVTERRLADEQIRMRNQELTVLNRISLEATKLLDAAAILQFALDEALRITGLDGGTVCLVSKENTLELVAERNISETARRDLTNSSIVVGTCLCGTCAADQKPLILASREEVLRYSSREARRDEDIRFHAAYPIIVKGESLGVLCVFAYSDKKPSERSLTLLETVVAQLSLTLANAGLYKNLNQTVARLEHAVAERTRAEQTLQQAMEIQKAINDILLLSLSSSSIEEILGQALDIIIRIPSLSFDAPTSIFLAEQHAHTLRLVAGTGSLAGGSFSCGNMSFGECICGKAAETNRIIYSPEGDPQLAAAHTGMPPHGQYCVPILHDNVVLGVFSVAVRPGHQRTEQEDALLHAVATTLAGVIIRKEADTAILKSEHKFRTLFDFSTDGVFIVDSHGRFIDVNRTSHERLGYTKQELIDLGIQNLDPPEFAARVPERIGAIMRHGQAIFESAHRRKDGTIMPVEINSRLIEYDGRQALFSMIRDITERKRAEQDLTRREAQLAESQRIAHVGSWERDLATNRVAWSDETFRIFGLDPKTVSPTFEVLLNAIHPDDRAGMQDAVMNALSSGGGYRAEFHITRPDGTLRCVRAIGEVLRDASGKPNLLRGTLQDITDQRKAEEEKERLQNQLTHSQRMETIGQLAGGVAHDFNNILTAIMGDAFLLNMKMDKASPHRTYVQDILESAEKAAQLTQGLLAFGRKQLLNPKPLSLNELITKLYRLTSRLISEDIEYRLDLSELPLMVNADAGQLEQVLMNLVTNARDALRHGGAITITTRQAARDELAASSPEADTALTYALIAVSDTGVGMEPQTRERIFEPFFTTKEVGKGTGLGLSIVYGIVKQHNGFIVCDSTPGVGSTFRIYLPSSASRDEAGAPGLSAPRKGSESILLTEDDAMLRKTTRTLLEQFGYRIVEAVDGRDAIAKFRENRDAIDLVLMDIVMPNLNGRETAEQLRAVNPGIKILFTSGYPNDVISEKGELDEGVNFIPKGSSPVILVNRIREALDRRP